MAGRARRTLTPAGARAAVSEPRNAPALGLYLHIPFCDRICGYCTFVRGLLDEDCKRRYVDALVREIRRVGSAAGRPSADTIYVGGGTPTVLNGADVARLIGACREVFDIAPAAEVTLEANPESLTQPKLAAFREAGVNRLSVGVQSFRDGELALLGRLHNAARARESVRDSRAAGFDNVSLDLIMGLPGQTLADWLVSVDELAALAPVHASVYVLEIHPGAPLVGDMARAGLTAVADDLVADMYIAAMERLEEAGYRQYEISNLARPGRESRHNLKYWTDGHWIGFGSAAHSTRDGVRWKNVPGTEEYMDRIAAGQDAAEERRTLITRERLEDALFMGLRLAAGVDAGALGERYGADVWETYRERLAPFVEAGLLIRDRRRLRLTRSGMLLANEVMAAFV